jgi:16S rRNA (guanine966-N2)-methyltransferase
LGTRQSGGWFFLFAQLPNCPIASFSAMRITAGEHRGRRLQSPKGFRTRPTSDLLRQAIFNVVGARIQGARVLDLFAGTGALGLEALSRGATAATFVEQDRTALTSLQANLSNLGLSARARIVPEEALAALAGLARAGEQFDCVFLDPPYAGDLARRCVETLAPGEILSENAVLVVQAFHRTELSPRIGILSQAWRRRYGETRLTLYRKESACT